MKVEEVSPEKRRECDKQFYCVCGGLIVGLLLGVAIGFASVPRIEIVDPPDTNFFVNVFDEHGKFVAACEFYSDSIITNRRSYVAGKSSVVVEEPYTLRVAGKNN